jgi:hypothetical protein
MWKPNRFDNKHISQRTGKKIPLDPATNEPHNCPMWKQQRTQQTGRRYLQCSKGCGSEIYFDVKTKRETGKWIPLSKETGERHICLATTT